MASVTFTTTLGEMNQLYGAYVEATNGEQPNAQQAEKAWVDYETYVRRYQAERGLNVKLEPQGST